MVNLVWFVERVCTSRSSVEDIDRRSRIKDSSWDSRSKKKRLASGMIDLRDDADALVDRIKRSSVTTRRLLQVARSPMVTIENKGPSWRWTLEVPQKGCW